jgi:hypothetical protein
MLATPWPDQPAADDTCHFFGLPGELRNAVYAFYLQSEEPLHFLRDPDGDVGRLYGELLAANDGEEENHDPLQGPEYEINQLRFVNKQLYAETCGLAICDNELVIYNITDANILLQGCKPDLSSRIRSLHVHGIDSRLVNLNEQMLRTVLYFCRRNPKVPVKAYLHGNVFLVHERVFVLGAIMWEMYMKQSTRLLKMFFVDSDHEKRIPKMQRHADQFFRVGHEPLGLFAIPPNLRFYPKAEEFQQRILEQALLRSGQLPEIRDAL